MQMPARTLLCAFIFWGLLALNARAQYTGVTKTFLMGRHDYEHDTTFVKVARKYCVDPNKTIFLKKEAYNAYLKMFAAAAKDGIAIKMVSGIRSFTDQQHIWERKWKEVQALGNSNAKNIALGVLNWSSMPGISRHHWGTDMDLVSVESADFESRAGKRIYAWLCGNAAKFGFYQPFDAGRSEGYDEEKWHWSYLPLAKNYLKEYIAQVTYADINGFKGFEAAFELDVIKSRVLAINVACK